jgi:C1A family cysteine protease
MRILLAVAIALLLLYIAYIIVQRVRWYRARRHYMRLAARLDIDPAPTPASQLPDAFDWREHGMHFDVPNQGTCGACWAWTAVIPLQHRFALAGNRVPALSAQYLLDCQAFCDNLLDPDSCDEGCSGGMIEHSWLFLKERGTPAESVVPFRGYVRPCAALPAHTQMYRAARVYRVPATVQAIRSEIMQRGPISASMDGYQCLVKFGSNDDIYEKRAGSASIGGHAVVLI